MSSISDEIRNRFSIDHCGSGLLVSNSECGRLLALADRIDDEMVELPKDADGVPIHVGDTVYTTDGSEAFVASWIRICLMTNTMHVKCGFSDGGIVEFRPDELTHIRPDSLERIADELEAWCDDVDVDGDGDGDACDVPRGIAVRIRTLAKKEGEQCQ